MAKKKPAIGFLVFSEYQVNFKRLVRGFRARRGYYLKDNSSRERPSE
jgi:hypothetical protein